MLSLQQLGKIKLNNLITSKVVNTINKFDKNHLIY